MKDLIKKGLLLGLGITGLSKEAIEKTVKEFEKKGEINTKEGKKMVRDLLEKSEKQKGEIKKIITAEIKKALKAMPLATKKDLATLNAKVDKLSKKTKKKK